MEEDEVGLWERRVGERFVQEGNGISDDDDGALLVGIVVDDVRVVLEIGVKFVASVLEEERN